MLSVLTPDEVLNLIETEFSPTTEFEFIKFDETVGRTLAQDIIANEYVPNFNRSTVDGYAVRASDIFGCSDSIPAILPVYKEILMGQNADFNLPQGYCVYVPTGGAIPNGADCAVMLEYTETYGDGTVGIMKAEAPGANLIYRGDDVYPGKVILNKGRTIKPSDIGAFAAIGLIKVPVVKKPVVGVISTGDELIPVDSNPSDGQIRDVNSPLLEALFKDNGADVINYGIVADDKELLRRKVGLALSECDIVVLSGGSSVGIKDAAYEIIESFGQMLMHGIAVKPGKPTIMGKCDNKPIVGLPGHPAAAYFVAKAFVLPLISRLMGKNEEIYSVKAILGENIGANHGRMQFNAVKIIDGKAWPIRSKSGLITQLAGADGYMCIERDCEGIEKEDEIEVFI